MSTQELKIINMEKTWLLKMYYFHKLARVSKRHSTDPVPYKINNNSKYFLLYFLVGSLLFFSQNSKYEDMKNHQTFYHLNQKF